jgi:hypothetical protein
MTTITTPASPLTREARRALLGPLLARRILVLDGAMGTMIQSYGLGEAEFRGAGGDAEVRLDAHHSDLRGDNTCSTQSAIVARSRRVPDAGRHRRDEHVQRKPDQPGGWPRTSPRHERGRCLPARAAADAEATSPIVASWPAPVPPTDRLDLPDVADPRPQRRSSAC